MTPDSANQEASSASGRLDSWKEIAVYLKRGVRTVQRWEQTADLPVHRLAHDKRGMVFAYKHEIDAWWAAQGALLEANGNGNGNEAEDADPVTVPAASSARNWKLGWVAAGLAAVAAIVFYAMGGHPAGTWTPPAAARVTPLTSLPGAECYPTFSPDGTQIAYAWNGESRTDFDIYVQVIGSGQPLRITTEPGSSIAPAWSPDGRYIAYFHHLGGYRLAMMAVSPLGGPGRKVTEFRAMHPGAPKTGMSWTADSRWVAWASLESENGWPRIEMVSVETGERKILTEPPPGVIGDLYPAFSPDGSKLLFVRMSGLRAGDLFMVELDSEHRPVGAPVKLTSDAAIIKYPSWLAGGREVIFSSLRGGRLELWRLDIEKPGEPRRVESLRGAGENVTQAAISPRGDRLALSSEASDVNVWQVRNALGKAELRSLISSTREEWEPQYSPDGKRIVFGSDRSGTPELWICGAEGDRCIKTTSVGGDMVGGAHWSPDGKQIAFDRQQHGRYDIFVMDDNGSAARRLTDDDAEDANPTWSPDGRWIYFDSNRSGEFEIWRIPAEGGESERVTTIGANNSTVSPDGRYLYFVRHAEAGGLWRQPLAGGDAEKVTESLAIPHTYALTRGGVFYMLPRRTDSKIPIRYKSYDGTIDREITAVSQFISSGFSATPDGDSVIFLQWDQHDGDLMLAENFQ